jgi:hypothetical protein
VALGLTGEEMGTPASNKKQCPEPYSGKTRVIVIGIVLAVIGSLIAGSFAKETITNYAGFIMLLTGISLCAIGVFATATACVRTRCNQKTISVTKTRILCLSIWSVGIGVVLAVVGSIIGSAYAVNTMLNDIGYWSLLTGTGVFLVGIAGASIITLRCRKGSGVKGPKRRGRFSNILLIGVAVALVIGGFILAGFYAKESIMNYLGFGTLLAGIALLSMGVAKTVVAILKNRLYPNGKVDKNKPRLIFGSIWAMAIGLMLLINGSLIASSYEKSSLMNYAGFGMLLAGTSVFVYGMFETARISAMGYFSSKRDRANLDMEGLKQKEKLPVRLKNSWRNLVKTSAILNLIGVMVAIGLLFFSLWQLDLIVSGPVWYEYSPTGQGWSWPGPGAYANEYFQCFLWQTTIGQAYDTLFMLIFISFIVVFASAYFWPKGRAKK